MSLKRQVRVALFVVFLLQVAAPAWAGNYQIGVYYFPGWHSTSDYWKDLKGAAGSRSPGKPWPDREPLLGYYPEEQTWVAEKHIDMAASHGISFFAYDWYWDGKAPYLNHAIDGYLQAKNKSKLKFALLWANHYATPASLQDFSEMIDYWLKHYFHDKQYLKIDNKPVVVIFSPQALRDNAAKFGKTTKELLTLARDKARLKGIAGIYFIGASPANSYWVKTYLPASGYDAISAYAYHSRGFAGEFTGYDDMPYAVNYSELIEGYKSHWEWILHNSSLPYMVPMTAGWDKRPWRSNTPHDQCFSTPQSFRQMLVEAKKTIDRYPEKTKGLGIIYAWNEFGEGGYIEPTRKWQFQYLQAVKEVFGK